MPQRSVEALLFDMVGVLLVRNATYVPSSKEQHDAARIEALYNHVDDRRLLADVAEQLGLSPGEVDRALAHIPDPYERCEPLWRLLPALKRRHKLAIVNNGNAIAKRHWDEKFNFSAFDRFVNSAQEGVRKPDPRIYRRTCEQLGVACSACLFMDDLAENVEAARRLGMVTIWWTSPRRGLAQLRAVLQTVR